MSQAGDAGIRLDTNFNTLCKGEIGIQLFTRAPTGGGAV